jgi:hypothetical protein
MYTKEEDRGAQSEEDLAIAIPKHCHDLMIPRSSVLSNVPNIYITSINARVIVPPST